MCGGMICGWEEKNYVESVSSLDLNVSVYVQQSMDADDLLHMLIENDVR